MVDWHDSEITLPSHTPRGDLLHLEPAATTRLPFYLLDSLEIGDLPCVDVGCGHNWFQRFYPRIWGVDPGHARYRDELLTPEWWISNWGRWPRAFSICAMHFFDQDTISREVLKVRGLLSPGGRAMVAISRARVGEQSTRYDPERLCRTLADLPGLARMVWFDRPLDASMDGNVWLWFTA